MAVRTGPGKKHARALARLASAALFAILIAAFTPRPLAAQLPPDEDWRTIETARFRVTYPARLEPLARRAGGRAEHAWDRLADLLPHQPSPPVDLILTDHVDYSNGFANVNPRTRIVVYARPPVDAFGLAYFDDWMELVITHELTHVFHLDVTGALGRVLRALFGRVPMSWPFFPELDTPRWVVEGLAVYYESALTESGRGHGTYHDMVVRTAALEGRLETIDVSSGESPVWPGGERVYVYGGSFFEWLLARHGPDRMPVFIEAVGGQWIPYRLNSAARKAFGVSFSDEWRAWRGEVMVSADSTRRALAERAPLTLTEPITRGARNTVAPRISPDGRVLAFARADGISDAQIRIANPDGSDSRQLARANGVPFFAWAPDGSLIAAQLEFDDPYRVPSDLFRFDGVSVTRITRDARLDHPAVARDGRTAYAIQNRDGTTDLVRVDLQTGAVTPIVPTRANDVHWAFPAPSPDGRWLAAVRWTVGRSMDLVLLGGDGNGGWAVARAITDDRAIEQWPTWSPDGRWLLWGSDRSGIPNVYAAPVTSSGEVGPTSQVTNFATGIAYASVDPTQRWIYASVYHSDGWDVERFPFDPARWFEPMPLAPVYAPTTVPPLPPPAEQTAGPYRAIETLGPKFWTPLALPGETVFVPGRGDEVELLGPFLGFATAGSDVIGKHVWELSAALSTSDAEFEGSVGYGYQGLGNPLLSLFADQSWDASGPLTGLRSSGQVDTLFIRDRERRVQLASTLLFRRYQYGASLGLSAGYVAEDSELLDRDGEPQSVFRLDTPSSRLADLRASLSVSTARAHALAISTEEGAAVQLQGRLRRHLDLADTLRTVRGADRSFAEGIGRVRLYQPLRSLGLLRHVVGARLSAGVAQGPGADRFHFEVGGASGGADPFGSVSVLGGSSYSFPVRGYENGERAGRIAWSATAEYRFPIARVNRGIGLIPIHLDQVSGSLFADAGNAWGPEQGPSLPRFNNPRRDDLLSVGAELSADFLALFHVSLPLRGGVAFPQVDATGRGTSPVWYLRVGPSF